MSLTKITNRVIEPGTITANSLSENISVGGGDDVIINQIIITDENFANTENTQIPTTGGYLKIYGSGFQANANVYISTSFSLGSQVTANVVSSTEIRVTISAIQANTFNLFVFNTNGTQISKLGAVTSFLLQATAAWFSGGLPGSGVGTSVDRITFATDTATSTSRGSLSSNRFFISSTGNNNYGWWAGGYSSSSRVDRVTFVADTETSSIRGPLNVGRRAIGATGNDNFGWFGGGLPGPVSTVDRIDFADDTATASIRGPLSSANQFVDATGNDNFGWFSGGGATRVERITFADDTGTASVRGPLSSGRLYLAATGNDDFGWFGGGKINTPETEYSRVDRITFANDTGTASVRGPLSLNRSQLSAAGNNDYGWFGGGIQLATIISRVDRIDFADDTSTTSIRGPLRVVRRTGAATSGIA